MKEVSEGNLTFEFPDEWVVSKYDESQFYSNRVRRCQDVKAVDILADSVSEVFVIEVKDFRGHRIEHKERVKNHELAAEVAKKVRDTVAGLYGAYRDGDEELRSICARLFAPRQPTVRVVLFFEEDRPPTSHKSFKSIRSDLRLKIQQRLGFLQVRCTVHNREEMASGQYGWKVK